MSLADNKRNVFTTIGAYTSFAKQNKPPKKTDLYPSINNKKDVVPFLLDTLKTVAGTDALKEVIGGMFTKLLDEAEPKLKTALKKQFVQSNAGENLGTDMTNNGVTLPVENIDTTGKLKLSPNSSSGNLLYDKTTANFDRSAYNAILNAGSDTPYNNMILKYNSSTDTMTIKPVNDMQIGKFFGDYIDNTEIINKKELVTNVMDRIYGTLSAKDNKTVEQIYSELEIEVLLQQAINDDDSFVVPSKDYNEMLQKARETALGVVTYDMGCGLLAASLSFDSLNQLVTTISGSTDPFVVGNAIENTIYASTSGSTSTQETTEENKETIKDGFFQRLINIFVIKLTQAMTTAPQIRSLLAMMTSLQNNGTTQIAKAKEDMKKTKIFINCMVKEIMRMIAEFIFALVIAYLIKLIMPVIQKVVIERITLYVKQLKSLNPANRLTGNLTG